MKIENIMQRLSCVSFLLNHLEKLNNILRLNMQLFLFNEKVTELYSHCRLEDETTSHLFPAFIFAINLWNNLK